MGIDRSGPPAGRPQPLIVTLAVALPGLDEGATELTLVSLGALVLWTAVAAVTPTRWVLTPAAPLGLAALPVSLVSAALVLEAVARVAYLAEPFTRDAAVRLPAQDSFVHPALLVPSLLALSLAFAVLQPGPRPFVRLLVPVAGATAALGVIATLALTPAPLWSIVAAVSAAGAAAIVGALRRTDRVGTGAAGAGVLLLLLAVLAALPSAVLTTLALVVLVAAAVAVERSGRFPLAHVVGGVTLPAAAAGLLWSAAEVAGVDEAYRAAPILLVVGLLAILLPRIELEATAAAVGPRRRAARHRGGDRRALVARAAPDARRGAGDHQCAGHAEPAAAGMAGRAAPRGRHLGAPRGSRGRRSGGLHAAVRGGAAARRPLAHAP